MTSSKSDRRDKKRQMAGIDAVLTNGQRVWRAQICDLSCQGLSLIVQGDVPRSKVFRVEAEANDGGNVVFEVAEVHRHVEGEETRLGFEIVDASDEALDFFLVAKSDTCDESDGLAVRTGATWGQVKGPSEGPWPGKTRQCPRIEFHLPAMVSIAGSMFRGQTIDIGALGLSVVLDAGFPKSPGDFPLICLDPDGAEMKLLVREVYRKAAKQDPSQVKLGLKALKGNAGFRSFVVKHRLSSASPVSR